MPRLKDPNAWFQKALKVAQDPVASDWLKNALVEAINRDPVDAANDAEILCRILLLRAAAVVQKSGAPGTAGKLPKSAASARIEP
jgi:tRNA U34 5-methylaminomethyl-2-thiouridine-forming methyltransferase MnmC